MPSTQYVVVRTTGDPDALVATLRAIVKGGKPDGRARGRHDHGNAADAERARPRLYAVLLGGFATVALLIAVIGLFGGLSYAVTQRTREIGVRTALGAAPRDIMGLVVKPGTLMSAVGLTLGLGLAAASGPYLAGFSSASSRLMPGRSPASASRCSSLR